MKKYSNRNIKDNWNAFLVEGAVYPDGVFPFSPSVKDEVPERIITWTEALSSEDHDAWVCFYEPEDAYDSIDGIWADPKRALKILNGFRGVIIPDFDRNPRTPYPVRYWNVYRSHALGYWLNSQGIPVINSVAYDHEFWYHDCDAFEKGSVIALDTQKLDPAHSEDRWQLDASIHNLMERLKPSKVIVYGPVYEGFKRFQKVGIELYSVDVSTGYVSIVDTISDSMIEASIDYSADVIPGKSAAGITLGTPFYDLKDIVDAGDSVLIQHQRDSCCFRIGNRVELSFASSNDRLFMIGLLPGYTGRILGFDDIWNMTEDVFMDGYGDFTWLDEAEVYQSRSLGLDIAFDYKTGHVFWVGILVESTLGDCLEQDLSDWTISPEEREAERKRNQPVDFFTEGAEWDYMMPICPTTSDIVPKRIITWERAKASEPDSDAFVCFYQYDENFDGRKSSIWNNPENALSVLSRFGGVITPDFSTYVDFPEPIRMYNMYRMRAFGYWLGKHGIKVINNVRWCDADSYWYSFRGIEHNSIVSIGTVGGNPVYLENRDRFINGLEAMVKKLSPKVVILYGGGKDPCFEELKARGIDVRVYDSQTNQAFKKSTLKKGLNK